MGKKQRAQQKKQKKQEKLPFVSICTPTFNRRPFIPTIIKCYLAQDYPRDKMEWIIIDDGFDKVGDLFEGVPNVKYYPYEEKMTLGKKRNLMHLKTKGDIIVYMDDDDFYPPDRVSHAVDKLQKHPQALCAGSSEIYIWFKHIQSMYQFGPYGPNHATAGTFAFKRKLLRETKYNETASLAEEKEFLKDYTIPFVQLDPLKTILVFSHHHNTFDKKKLLESGENQFQKKSTKIVDNFIKDADIKDFFVNQIEGLLKNYDPGDPKYKPDVLKQTEEIQKKREQMKQEHLQQQPGITIENQDGTKQQLNMQQVIQLLQHQQNTIQQLQKQVQSGGSGSGSNSDLGFELEILKYRVEELTEENNKLNKEVKVLKGEDNIDEYENKEQDKKKEDQNNVVLEIQENTDTIGNIDLDEAKNVEYSEVKD